MEVSTGEVEIVATGRAYPIRCFVDSDFWEKLRAQLIIQASAVLGADSNSTTSAVWSEALVLIKKSFSDFGPDEIIQAFRLAAANRLSCDVTAYRGVFTTSILGDILSAYRVWRNKIVAELVEIEHREKEEKAKEAKRQAFELQRIELLQEFEALQKKNNKYRSHHDLPAILCRIVSSAGLLEVIPRGEKGGHWIAAKKFTVEDFKRKNQRNEVGKFTAAWHTWNLLEENEDELPETLTLAAQTDYSRRLVFSLIATYEN